MKALPTPAYDSVTPLDRSAKDIERLRIPLRGTLKFNSPFGRVSFGGAFSGNTGWNVVMAKKRLYRELGEQLAAMKLSGVDFSYEKSVTLKKTGFICFEVEPMHGDDTSNIYFAVRRQDGKISSGENKGFRDLPNALCVRPYRDGKVIRFDTVPTIMQPYVQEFNPKLGNY